MSGYYLTAIEEEEKCPHSFYNKRERSPTKSKCFILLKVTYYNLNKIDFSQKNEEGSRVIASYFLC